VKTLSSWYTHFKCTFTFGGICDALIYFYIIWISLAFNAQCTVVGIQNNHWFSVEHLDAMWTNDMYHIADKWSEMTYEYIIPNAYNSFLLWFYRVFLHVAFLGSRNAQNISYLFLVTNDKPKNRLYSKKKISFDWKGTSVDWTIELTSCGWNRNFATQLISQKIDRLTDVPSILFEWKLIIKQSRLPNWFGSCWLLMWTLFRLKRNGKPIILALPR